LLGHKSARITTHYSAAEISNLIDAANKVYHAASQKVGGKGGINTGGASRCFLKIFSNRANFHTNRSTGESGTGFVAN
jgi:hypothetical protein